MDDIVKLIEDSKTYSNELNTEVLPVSVVRKIVQELHSSQFSQALNSIQDSVSEINSSIRSIAEGDVE